MNFLSPRVRKRRKFLSGPHFSLSLYSPHPSQRRRPPPTPGCCRRLQRGFHQHHRRHPRRRARRPLHLPLPHQLAPPVHGQCPKHPTSHLPPPSTSPPSSPPSPVSTSTPPHPPPAPPPAAPPSPPPPPVPALWLPPPLPGPLPPLRPPPHIHRLVLQRPPRPGPRGPRHRPPNSLSLLPIYCFDLRDYGKSSARFDKTGPYRAAFLLRSVTNMRKSLRPRGSDLLVHVGRPEAVLAEMAKAVGTEAVYNHWEVSHDEVRAEEKVGKAMEEEGVEVKYFWWRKFCWRKYRAIIKRVEMIIEKIFLFFLPTNPIHEKKFSISFIFILSKQLK